MYKLQKLKTKTSRCIVVNNRNNGDQLQINLDEGGRLTLYKHQGHIIISDLEDSSYSTNYASAILFPFANRVKNGTYSHNKFDYKLVCNEQSHNNAIHGLVYDKPFELVNFKEEKHEASLTLNYKELKGTHGFPFKYSISLTYILNDHGISLSIRVKNEDEHTFPFTLGWHPYFKSSNMTQSQLILNSIKQFTSDHRGLVIDHGIKASASQVQLGRVVLDNVFEVSADMAEFVTPDYHLKLHTDHFENYLQVYTPEDTSAIAIEPMLGVSDSFNHKIGLKELQPGESFEKTWHLNVVSVTQKIKS